MKRRSLLPAAFYLVSVISILFQGCKKQPGSCTDERCLNALIDSVANILIAQINVVSSSDAFSFQSKDDLGNSMDCAKIIRYQDDTFIAVYHTYDGVKFNVHLAISTDLMHWIHKNQMGVHASQPTIFETANKKFIVAWEQDPNNHIRVLRFGNFDQLLSNQNMGVKDISHTLSLCAEGTPNIYNADDASIDIGYHYWRNCDVDREARGTLYNFANWSAKTENHIDSALLKLGLHGNIGDRDAFVFRNIPFVIIEGQKTKDNFGTWDLFLYNHQTDKAYPVHLQTPLGATSFGNPTISILRFQNRDVIVITTFIFSGGTESADLIYYKFI